MRREFTILILVICGITATAAFGVRRVSRTPSWPPLRPEVVYFAYHLNARLEDDQFEKKDWGMPRLQKEVDQMFEVFQTNNSHDDLVKEAIDVAVSAMMAAHTEGKKSRPYHRRKSSSVSR